LENAEGNIMAIKTNNQIELHEGFSLGYAELGDPAGWPILHFHGMPSSSSEVCQAAFDQVANRLGVRLIAIDRPGYAMSDFRRFKIVDWPAMVSEFADRLGLGRFSVMGISSGPKYVAACAWKLPHRVNAAALVSANAPIQPPEVAQALSSQDRQLYMLARYTPWLMRLVLGSIARNARKDSRTVLGLFPDLCPADRALLEAPGGVELLGDMVIGAFRQGTQGVAWDWKLEALPWGFPLAEIRTACSVWHGESDTLVPPAHGQYLAKAIPNCQAHFVPGEGHMSLLSSHFEDIIKKLAGC
jgi:pimeloyl-ACP methyl ester carboxylesterase